MPWHSLRSNHQKEIITTLYALQKRIKEKDSHNCIRPTGRLFETIARYTRIYTTLAKQMYGIKCPPICPTQQTPRINLPTKYFTFGDKSCPFFVLVPSLLILCEVSQNRVTAVHSTVRFNVTDIENNYQAMLNVRGAPESVCQY